MPDDPKVTEMDPVQKMWMYNMWIADQNDMIELAKNHAYLAASFDHPEAVRTIVTGAGTHVSSDEEYEESLQIVRNSALKIEQLENAPVQKRRRKKRK